MWLDTLIWCHQEEWPPPPIRSNECPLGHVTLPNMPVHDVHVPECVQAAWLETPSNYTKGHTRKTKLGHSEVTWSPAEASWGFRGSPYTQQQQIRPGFFGSSRNVPDVCSVDIDWYWQLRPEMKIGQPHISPVVRSKVYWCIQWFPGEAEQITCKVEENQECPGTRVSSRARGKYFLTRDRCGWCIGGRRGRSIWLWTGGRRRRSNLLWTRGRRRRNNWTWLSKGHNMRKRLSNNWQRCTCSSGRGDNGCRDTGRSSSGEGSIVHKLTGGWNGGNRSNQGHWSSSFLKEWTAFILY